MTSSKPSTCTGTFPVIRYWRTFSVILSVALLGSSCAYFNTFYNARDFYRQGVVEIEAAGFQSEDSQISAATRSSFEKAIEKSHEVIDEYSDSKYVEEAQYIIARSHFYLGELGLAERYLNQILDEYPNHERTAEARLFLAKTHHSMGALDQVREDLAPLLDTRVVSKQIMTEIYILQGDIAIEANQMQEAIRRFQFAAEFAPRDALRAQIYYRLFTLLQADGLLRVALEFHDQYRQYTPNLKDRRQAVLIRVQLLQELGDFTQAYKEIRSMLTLSEFADVAPGLQLELARVERARGNESDYVSQLENIMEEFSSLAVASGAAYLLGEHALLRLRDFDAAKGHYSNVKPSTPDYAQSRVRLKQLERLEGLKRQFESLTLEPSADEVAADSGDVGVLDSVGLVSPGIGDAATIASLLYRIGEITFIDLADSARAMEYMAQIYHQYEETPTAPRAVYILYLMSPPNSESQRFWENILMESYGKSQFASMVSGKTEVFTESGIDSLATLAGEALQISPAQALRLFEQIRDRFRTEQSTFAIAYINDIYLSNLDLAIDGYEEHLDTHEEGLYSETAIRRLNFLLEVKAEATNSEYIPVYQQEAQPVAQPKVQQLDPQRDPQEEPPGQ